MYEVSGKIKLISDTQTYPSGFSKREFVVTTEDSKYPQDLKFEVMKDKCSVLDDFKEGQPVNVNFDIRGNEYNGKYYVNLNCWKIGGKDGGGGSSNNEYSQEEAPRKSSSNTDAEPSASDLRNDDDFDDDDIPF